MHLPYPCYTKSLHHTCYDFPFWFNQKPLNCRNEHCIIILIYECQYNRVWVRKYYISKERKTSYIEPWIIKSRSDCVHHLMQDIKILRNILQLDMGNKCSKRGKIQPYQHDKTILSQQQFSTIVLVTSKARQNSTVATSESAVWSLVANMGAELWRELQYKLITYFQELIKTPQNTTTLLLRLALYPPLPTLSPPSYITPANTGTTY